MRSKEEWERADREEDNRTVICAGCLTTFIHHRSRAEAIEAHDELSDHRFVDPVPDYPCQ